MRIILYSKIFMHSWLVLHPTDKKPRTMKKLFFFMAFAAILSAFEMITHTSSTITGVVSDEAGTPLIGVAVLEKGTQNGTVTDLDGKFSLQTTQKCATLTFNFIGYQSLEKAGLCEQETHKITLLTSNTMLDEVTVVSRAKERKARTKKDRSRRNIPRPMMAQAPGITTSRMMAKPIGRPDAQSSTEEYDLIKENNFLNATQKPLSTFSIDVDAAAYSNLRRFINNNKLPPKDAIRVEEMINYFDYDYPAPNTQHPFTVISEIADCPWAPQHKLLHIGMQAKQIPASNLPPSNLVFLIDVSGSMSAQNKLPLLKSAFKLLVDQLRPNDKVAIVVYAGAAGLVLPPTSGSDKQKIKDAFEKLQAGGSTAGGAGIKLAYKTAAENFVQQGNNRIILATDGDFNVGASSDADMVRMIEKERESGVFLTVLGFGMGNYKDSKMQQLANKGNGNHAYIDNIDEAKKVLVNEFGATMYAVAKDVKFQLEFNPAKVQGYRLIGYENRLLNDEDFNDDKKDAGELGAGHTVTALYEIIPAGVETDWLTKIDPLKYQDPKPVATQHADEICQVKLRYKTPEGKKSQLIEQAVTAQASPLSASSDNFRWSASVASLGMLLRDSEFKGDTNFEKIKYLAKSAIGKDTNGYRQEFIELVEKAQSLKTSETAGK